MRFLILVTAALVLNGQSPARVKTAAAPRGDIQNGKKLFMNDG